MGDCRYKLTFGLGNPGFQYKKTLHNAGFMVIDRVVKELGIRLNKKRFQSGYAVDYLDEHWKFAYIKPRLYMNLSGECVEQFISYVKRVDTDDILIVYDDIETPAGHIVLDDRGECRDHGGMANVIERLGTDRIKRIRVGIRTGEISDPKKYVLTEIGKEHRDAFEEGLNLAKDAVIHWRRHNFKSTMEAFNRLNL